jgi:hypothetical protein
MMLISSYRQTQNMCFRVWQPSQPIMIDFGLRINLPFDDIDFSAEWRKNDGPEEDVSDATTSIHYDDDGDGMIFKLDL